MTNRFDRNSVGVLVSDFLEALRDRLLDLLDRKSHEVPFPVKTLRPNGLLLRRQLCLSRKVTRLHNASLSWCRSTPWLRGKWPFNLLGHNPLRFILVPQL